MFVRKIRIYDIDEIDTCMPGNVKWTFLMPNLAIKEDFLLPKAVCWKVKSSLVDTLYTPWKCHELFEWTPIVNSSEM